MPNAENNARRLGEHEWALARMSNEQLQALGANLSEKIDVTILDSWAQGDISADARSTFNHMIQRRAEQQNNDGSATMELQRALNAMGFKLKVDGDCGQKTQEALARVFSSSQGIQAFAKRYKAERLKTQNNARMMAFQAQTR